MSTFAQLFDRIDLSQSQAAAALGVSKAALSLALRRNQWPRRDPDLLRTRLSGLLVDHGFDAQDVAVADAASRTPSTTITPASSEDSTMIRKQRLTAAAKEYFGVKKDIFSDNLEDSRDVYLSNNIRDVREALLDCAGNGGFLAVIGESGSGKSTLRRDLIERIRKEEHRVIIIEPSVLGMEENDKSGKRLKASHIAEAILYSVAPSEKLRISSEARHRQLRKALTDSCEAGYRHCLIIEEAHRLSVQTIKHLKGFFELEYGFKRLLSIILIGQPELEDKLSESASEVREVVQRLTILHLQPLDDLIGYVRHRCKRAGVEYDKLFDDSAFAELEKKLTGPKSRDGLEQRLTWPLSVGNHLTRGMNKAAEIFIGKVTDVVMRKI